MDSSSPVASPGGADDAVAVAAPRRRLRRLGMIVALGLAGFFFAWFALPWCVSLPPALLAPREVSRSFLASDGTPLRQLLSGDGQRAGLEAAFRDIPACLVHATLAAEDKRFFSHGGVDWLAIARAARDNRASGRIVSGASTLTQQLVKISTSPRPRRTLAVKIIEALQARQLEMRWSKEQILVAWLNRVTYGNLFTGCAAAASGYFNKPLGDLTPAEAAFLAALPQAPGRLNPFRDPKPAIERQRRVLALMRENGWLDDPQLALASAQALTLDHHTGGFEAPHAVEMMAAAGIGPAPLVRTTIDAALQKKIETIIAQRLAGLASRHVTHASAVVIENATGHVLALAGSRDFLAPDGGQINGAWTPNSPGSAIKPFTYLMAFERGHTPATIVADLPVEFTTSTGIYRPENYDHKLYGPVTYRDALGNSLNIAAVKVLRSTGGEDQLLGRLRDAGLSTLTEDASHYGLGLTIGNAPVRLLELANAYACVARMGAWKPWALVPDGGKTERRVFEALNCYLVADILSDNQARLLAFGARSPLRLPFRVAVKTGTSSTYRDNWTLGFVPEFTVGVWAGNFDNTPMQNVSGVTGAAPIFNDIMTHLSERERLTWYERPARIVTARIDPRLGKRADPRGPPPRSRRDEIFIAGTEPPFATSRDYTGQGGRAILPPDYSRWAASRDNWLGDLVAVAGSDRQRHRPLRITNPVSGMVVRLDPDIRNHGSRLLLAAEASGEVAWSSPTLSLIEESGSRIAVLTPGTHEILARDPASGEVDRAVVIVHEE